MRFRIPTGVWVTLGTIAFMVWFIGTQEKQRQAREAKPIRTGPPCVTKEGWQFARTEAVLDAAGRFVAQGDKAAFEKLIASGTLRPLKAGVAVYLEPGGGFGHAAIRFPGELGHVWVPNEAIECIR
jgi:hypothetical protein